MRIRDPPLQLGLVTAAGRRVAFLSEHDRVRCRGKRAERQSKGKQYGGDNGFDAFPGHLASPFF